MNLNDIKISYSRDNKDVIFTVKTTILLNGDDGEYHKDFQYESTQGITQALDGLSDKIKNYILLNDHNPVEDDEFEER